MADRTYYRRESDQRLIEEAKYNPNRELAIALGERLDDVLSLAEIDIGDRDELIADLQRVRTKLGQDLEAAEDRIADLEAEIEALKKEHKQ